MKKRSNLTRGKKKGGEKYFLGRDSPLFKEAVRVIGGEIYGSEVKNYDSRLREIKNISKNILKKMKKIRNIRYIDKVMNDVESWEFDTRNYAKIAFSYKGTKKSSNQKHCKQIKVSYSDGMSHLQSKRAKQIADKLLPDVFRALTNSAKLFEDFGNEHYFLYHVMYQIASSNFRTSGARGDVIPKRTYNEPNFAQSLRDYFHHIISFDDVHHLSQETVRAMFLNKLNQFDDLLPLNEDYDSSSSSDGGDTYSSNSTNTSSSDGDDSGSNSSSGSDDDYYSTNHHHHHHHRGGGGGDSDDYKDNHDWNYNCIDLGNDCNYKCYNNNNNNNTYNYNNTTGVGGGYYNDCNNYDDYNGHHCHNYYDYDYADHLNNLYRPRTRQEQQQQQRPIQKKHCRRKRMNSLGLPPSKKQYLMSQRMIKNIPHPVSSPPSSMATYSTSPLLRDYNRYQQQQQQQQQRQQDQQMKNVPFSYSSQSYGWHYSYMHQPQNQTHHINMCGQEESADPFTNEERKCVDDGVYNLDAVVPM